MQFLLQFIIQNDLFLIFLLQKKKIIIIINYNKIYDIKLDNKIQIRANNLFINKDFFFFFEKFPNFQTKIIFTIN